jgi:uncharacterized protein YbaP (TraB family)
MERFFGNIIIPCAICKNSAWEIGTYDKKQCEKIKMKFLRNFSSYKNVFKNNMIIILFNILLFPLSSIASDSSIYDWCYGAMPIDFEKKMDEFVINTIKDNPDRYTNGSGRIFSVKNSKNNSEVIIIGSMHNIISVISNRSLYNYYRNANYIYTETYAPPGEIPLAPPRELREPKMSEFLAQFRNPPTYTLDLLRRELAVSQEALDEMPVADVAQHFLRPRCGVASAPNWMSELGIDALIHLWGRIDGKQILGIQTNNEVAELIYKNSTKEDLFDNLEEEINLYYINNYLNSYIIKNYFNGNISKTVIAASMYNISGNKIQKFYQKQKIFTDNRNVKISEAISQSMNIPGLHLYIFGAAHIIGKNGVLNLLQNNGYDWQIINPDHIP